MMSVGPTGADRRRLLVEWVLVASAWQVHLLGLGSSLACYTSSCTSNNQGSTMQHVPLYKSQFFIFKDLVVFIVSVSGHRLFSSSFWLCTKDKQKTLENEY